MRGRRPDFRLLVRGLFLCGALAVAAQGLFAATDLSAKGSGATLSEGVYYLNASKSFAGGVGQAGLAVADGATVAIYLPENVTLTVHGASASGATAGTPGLSLPASSTLILVGKGRVEAFGGAAADGRDAAESSSWDADAHADGERYVDGAYSGAWNDDGDAVGYRRGKTYGGKGGAGGGGAAAGIGGRGGGGGGGGSCGVVSHKFHSYDRGLGGANGEPGGGGGGSSLGKAAVAAGGVGGGGAGGYMDASRNKAIKGEAGVDGLGGGGGGGGRYFHHTPVSYAASYLLDWGGGRGGDGVVIVRFHPDYKDASKEPGTGGNTITKIRENGTNYMIHVFTESGTFEIAESVKAELLVVGGGGAGGANSLSFAGGGGGAGGVVHVESGLVPAGRHAVTVGAGGSVGVSNGNGEPSLFGVHVAEGGGGGGGGKSVGCDGASGGGAGGHTSSLSGGTGTSGQGHNGGANYAGSDGQASKPGGGGGAGAAGGDGTSSSPGAGGDGISCAITGTAVYYGGGGGGGHTYIASTGVAGGNGGGGTGAYTYSGNNSRIPATAGAPNSGGGGGGGGKFGGYAIAAADGGSGVVIIRYALEKKGLAFIIR